MKRASLLLCSAFALVACSEGVTETSPDPESPCKAAAAEGIIVAASDPYSGAPYALGYPPYAIEGCSLAYVTPFGDLRLRDLVDGTERTLDDAAALPRRPAITGDLVAWEATLGGRDVVRVRDAKGTVTLEGAFDHAREPRVAKDSVVFTAWLGAEDLGDTDVLLYTPSSSALTVVASGAGQQRFADVSATHIAWTDFAEDIDLAFGNDENDVADIVVLDRESGVVSPRKREGKQGFPELGAEGKIAYLDWGLVHPEPKFSEYHVRLGPVVGDGANDTMAAHIISHVLYLRPAARGTRLTWISAASLGGDLALMQRGVDLVDPAETVSLFPDQSAFRPAISNAITLVGASGAEGAVTLRAFNQ